ncbi:aspartyl protease family protein [Altererythrobacter sp. Root672]|uniref:aspartyl protease family protein n=1 Tax=Altererythrobacter sp. Root672 TaxID=1736584 RepID=UPI0006F270F0|nr:aspartyl protease family protein [Altererythrobacter sp. Root672]KRA81359.1 hypothetical protein ASD76_12420 [Altererythrobacter sp. Root672]
MGWQHLAAAVTLVTGLSGASAQDIPGDIPEVEIITLEDERYRRMTVPVTIGENGPFQFMIDTGAQATVVSRDLADRLQLFDRDEATLVGMASRRQVETTPIENVRLGSRNFFIENAPVIEGEHIGGADGILGLDSLQNQRVLIDFIKKEMSVADAAQLGGNRGFEIIVKARSKLGQLIITNARLDGIPVAVIIDTGAQGSIGNPALQARMRRGRHLGETELTDINGVALAGTIRVAGELDLGRAKLSNLAVMYADSPSFHSLGLSDKPALVLGMSELKLFRRVAIDFQTRRVLFDIPRGS